MLKKVALPLNWARPPDTWPVRVCWKQAPRLGSPFAFVSRPPRLVCEVSCGRPWAWENGATNRWVSWTGSSAAAAIPNSELRWLRLEIAPTAV